ncbi:MAG TPA: outer membrane protein assembly factor BamD [Vicinamibacterales bacterium]|nr:outer membrane protein assembly factor BamD [Vicinamibacterales bacterium]
MKTPFSLLCLLLLCPLLLLTLFISGCGAKGPVTAGPGEADRILFDRGKAALKEKRWATSRQYFAELLESYPQSALRAEAKLGVGDAFLGESNSASYVYAQNEYREFLAFYPTNPRADYAQMQLGMVHFKQMLNPQRDQTETKEAIREFQVFMERYPNSSLAPEVKLRLREAKDRLSDSDMVAGNFYLSINAVAGAEKRYRHVLKEDPEYTRKDSLYFHLAEALEKYGVPEKKAEALPYYERLVREYEKSEYLEEAKRRIALLKDQLKTTTAGL